MKFKILLSILIIISFGANIFLAIKLEQNSDFEKNEVEKKTSLFSKFPNDFEITSKQTFGNGKFELISAFRDLDAKQSSIWIYDKESNIYHKIAQSLDYTIFSSPRISPDEKHLAFMQLYPFAVKIADLETNLTEVIYSESNPNSLLAPSITKNYETSLSWQDSRTLLFQSNKEVDEITYAIDIYNRNIQEIKRKKADTSRKNVEINVPHLSQRDKKWSTEQLGGCEKQTIESAGCAVTTLAMISSYYGSLINPSEMNKIFVENSEQGYFNGCDVKWYIASQLRDDISLKWVYFNEYNLDRVHAELNAGNPVIIGFNNVPFTKIQHWVVITGFQDGQYIINDPWDFLPNSKTLEDFGGKFDHMIVFTSNS